MIVGVVLISIVVLLAINIALWKFGFIDMAARPKLVEDKPVMDAKERRAIMKRIDRWREEGKLTREQYEVFLDLCRSEWDEIT
jgi:hypothetical protein